ncbi:MAG: repair protein RecO [Pseudomonadota bacterium]|jgi:DNA repair protein RecO (recombination protein O)
MKIFDRAIILTVTKFQEDSAIITLFSRENGIYRGIARNYNSSKNSPIYQPGNLVDFSWAARLANHLGNIKCELISAYGSMVIHNKTKLYALMSILSIIASSVREEEKYTNLFEYLKDYLSKISLYPFDFLDYIKIELVILEEIGYSLDLSKCAATGTTENLKYVSPKSGKAVSEQAGSPYSSMMLKLPSFLHLGVTTECKKQIAEAIELTGYFFKRYIFTNQNLDPNSRLLFAEHITQER